MRKNILRAVSFDERFLEISWTWLNDEEIRRLTMTPVFTKEQQRVWFAGLRERTDYVIWGVEMDGKPIGAFGLKNLNDTTGEYWGYIGDKDHWGQGIGRWMVNDAIKRAGALGLKHLWLRVLSNNLRAIHLYLGCGYTMGACEADTVLMAREV